MLSDNSFHVLLILSEYLSKQCLMLADNSFPATLNIIRKRDTIPQNLSLYQIINLK